jgi:Ca2+-transporting ATPase
MPHDAPIPAGLSTPEADRLRHEHGPNELPSGRRRLGHLLAEVLGEPMFLLLVACGGLYLALGDRQEAFLLLGFVFFIMILTLVQEGKTERALDALRDLSSPRARVLRDGQPQRIAGRDVVPGDLLILDEGDRVPADAQILQAGPLRVDESLLTGESEPTSKSVDATGDDGRVFAGTLIVQGQGLARVIATGSRTAMGRIGEALKGLTPEDTLLQRETRRLVKVLAMVGGALCAVVVVAYGVLRADWLNGFLAGLTLAMAILPNEFPMVLVIFLSLGAWRLSRHRVLTRRVAAVETLGAATVLCVDKTGTLTQNRMTIQSLVLADERAIAPDHPDAAALLACGVLASRPQPIDPMERAFFDARAKVPEALEHGRGWTPAREYPLTRGLLAMSGLWTSPDGREQFAAAKGAPEAIFDLCHMDPARQAAWGLAVERLAAQGWRVLGVAGARRPAAPPPENIHDIEFAFVGLAALSDPVRDGAARALAECAGAGLRVVMITGDHAGTARSVARAVGFPRPDAALTGAELDALGDDALAETIRNVDLFVRVVPEQKLRIVQALKRNGEVVAMTGDGVNDAPALRAAHIGIAMGERGTDVAREAADLVLLDDDFASLVSAVRLGRRVFDNLKKGMAYILAIHVPIAGMTILPVLLNMPLFLLPIHIAFLHLIIDPAGSVVFEAEPDEADVMNRPPRNPREPLFGRELLGASVLQGGVVLGVVLAVFALGLARGLPTDDARAVTFTTLMVANLGLIFTNRSWKRTLWGTLRHANPALWWVSGGSALFLAAALLVPFLRRLFHFTPLHPLDLGLALAAGAASVLWFDIGKRRRREATPLREGSR